MVEGESELSISNDTYTVSSGDAGIIFSNCIHKFHTERYSRFLYLVVPLSFVSDYQSSITGYRPLNPVIHKGTIHPDAKRCMVSLCENYKAMDIRLIKSYCSLIFGHLLSLVELAPYSYHSSNQLSNHILTYVTEHYLENITQQTVAHDLGTNPSTVSRAFNCIFGLGFNQYLNALRTEMAQQLLAKSELSITDIVYKSGFESQRTFNRVFKEITGQTPKEYRQQFISLDLAAQKPLREITLRH